MGTLIKNINSIKTAFSDVKTAIENKGIVIEDNTPVTAYAGLIDGISGGGTAKSYIFSDKHTTGIFTEVAE